MPKLIDHAERNRDITEAAMRVLERDGLARLSVRGVAEEAGIATASLRRAFASQDALREHCFQHIKESVGARLASHRSEGRALAAAALAEFLPLDAVRRTELIAQFHLGTLALTDENLRPLSIDLVRETRRACKAVAEELERSGLLRRAISTEAAADLLHAGVDGIALHTLLLGEEADWAIGRLERLLDAVCERRTT